ncbi:hypothetical protein [Halolamina sediminis]|nr:hypothetical protein [Halolamina sediminis]
MTAEFGVRTANTTAEFGVLTAEFGVLTAEFGVLTANTTAE